MCLVGDFFDGLYHGKSPLNHYLGEYFLLFSKHPTSKSKYIPYISDMQRSPKFSHLMFQK